MRQRILYRFFDDDNELLYVGTSTNFGRRLSDHLRHREWAPDIANIEIEHCLTIDEMLDRERIAIQTEHPKYNVVYGGRPRYRPKKTLQAPAAVAAATTQTDKRQLFIDALLEREKASRPNELALRSGVTIRTVHRWLAVLGQENLVHRVGYGRYAVTERNVTSVSLLSVLSRLDVSQVRHQASDQ